MGYPLPKDRVSLEGFEDLWEANEHTSTDAISKQIQAILKVLVDDRIALNQGNNLVAELKEHINSLQDQIQKLNWQLGQREKELSTLYAEHHLTKSQKEALEKQNKNHKELLEENLEIRKLAKELSNQILQEKTKNEQLVELLMQLKKPELKKIAKKLGI